MIASRLKIVSKEVEKMSRGKCKKLKIKWGHDCFKAKDRRKEEQRKRKI